MHQAILVSCLRALENVDPASPSCERKSHLTKW
jgi:hypothetical protein